MRDNFKQNFATFSLVSKCQFRKRRTFQEVVLENRALTEYIEVRHILQTFSTWLTAVWKIHLHAGQYQSTVKICFRFLAIQTFFYEYSVRWFCLLAGHGCCKWKETSRDPLVCVKRQWTKKFENSASVEVPWLPKCFLTGLTNDIAVIIYVCL